MGKKKLDLSKLTHLELKKDEMKEIKGSEMTQWVTTSMAGTDWHWGYGIVTITSAGYYC
jgi:hypothetical protein